MRTGVKVALGVVAGGVAGWFAARYYYTTKFDKILTETVEREVSIYKEHAEEKKEETTESESEPEPNPSSREEELSEADKIIERYNNLIRDCHYGNFEEETISVEDTPNGKVVSSSVNDTYSYDPEALENVNAYIIDPDDADDDEHFCNNLTYYSNGVLVDDDDPEQPLSSLDITYMFGEELALDFPAHFGDYPGYPRMLAIRNDSIMKDYILMIDYEPFVPTEEED